MTSLQAALTAAAKLTNEELEALTDWLVLFIMAGRGHAGPLHQALEHDKAELYEQSLDRTEGTDETYD